MQIDTESEAYKRVKSAGFEINNLEHGDRPNGYWVRVEFTCVCGTRELLPILMDEKPQEPFDIAKVLEEGGQLSAEHLKADGYTDEQIKYIRRAYD